MAKLATPLLIGAGALAVAASKKKKKKKRGHWGVYVSKDCQNVQITDSQLFRKFVLGGYKELITIDSNLDILQVTDSLYGEVAPHCSPFPENPESPMLAELYKRIVAGVTEAMILDGNKSVKEMVGSERAVEFSKWYAYWRNPPSPQIPQIVSNDVAFASDYSQYRIGNDWVSVQVAPFVSAMVEAKGATAQIIFDEFSTNRAVLVGQFYMPIADLPEDQPMVLQFKKQLSDAILKALSELG